MRPLDTIERAEPLVALVAVARCWCCAAMPSSPACWPGPRAMPPARRAGADAAGAAAGAGGGACLGGLVLLVGLGAVLANDYGAGRGPRRFGHRRRRPRYGVGYDRLHASVRSARRARLARLGALLAHAAGAGARRPRQRRLAPPATPTSRPSTWSRCATAPGCTRRSIHRGPARLEARRSCCSARRTAPVPTDPTPIPQVVGPSRAFADEPWIVAYQDVRGRYLSEGEWEEVRPYKPGKTRHGMGRVL